ncbi:MAG: hypothetical protein NC218_02255 [Acetobacter sp.]|nr:hypothetical protein [Acetobacter sp.]
MDNEDYNNFEEDNSYTAFDMARLEADMARMLDSSVDLMSYYKERADSYSHKCIEMAKHIFELEQKGRTSAEEPDYDGLKELYEASVKDLVTFQEENVKLTAKIEELEKKLEEARKPSKQAKKYAASVESICGIYGLPEEVKKSLLRIFDNGK